MRRVSWVPAIGSCSSSRLLSFVSCPRGPRLRPLPFGVGVTSSGLIGDASWSSSSSGDESARV